MSNPYKGKTGFKRIYSAFHNSLEGLRAAFTHEAAFRTELIFAVVLIALTFLIETNGVGKAMLIGSVLMVLIVELLNSAIEVAVDHSSLEEHPLAKRAKDIGSAAVFVSLLLLAVVWALILLG